MKEAAPLCASVHPEGTTSLVGWSKWPQVVPARGGRSSAKPKAERLASASWPSPPVLKRTGNNHSPKAQPRSSPSCCSKGGMMWGRRGGGVHATPRQAIDAHARPCWWEAVDLEQRASSFPSRKEVGLGALPLPWRLLHLCPVFASWHPDYRSHESAPRVRDCLSFCSRLFFRVRSTLVRKSSMVTDSPLISYPASIRLGPGPCLSRG